MTVEKITPKAGCQYCHGTGETFDCVDYGSTIVRVKWICECVLDQMEDPDNNDVEFVPERDKEEQCVSDSAS